ncbi:MAG: hypothetical protein LM563_02360 [Thermofilum sp.]|nr:hypothetical protein [Thermofilum sp.]
MSRSKASFAILLLFLAALPALAFSEPIIVHQVACHSTTKAILYNGTVLELPSLRPLAQLGPIEGCDIYEGYGERIAIWRGGQVEVYDRLSRRFTVRGDQAYIGSRFVLVTAKDFVAVYSLYGFQVFRLDSHTVPAYVRLLGAGKAGSKAVLLITPTLCKVRMQVESYLLVYDLDLGLWDIHQTGAVTFLAVPSGALWVKNGTLYHNGRAIGNAPDRLYPVNGFDGYAYAEAGKVVIVAMNGSTYTLPAPSGRELAISRLSEGFAACSDHECACTFNCTGFSEVARQAFSPPAAAETGTHYLLYANTVLYILEKPKPASTAPQGSTTPSGQPPMNATTPQNNTPTTQPPASTITPQNSTPLSNSTMPASSTLSTQQNATQPQPASPKQNTSQGSSTLLATPLIALAALALLGYTLHKRRHRYIA